MIKNHINPRKYRLMLVDDEMTIRFITKASLEKFGFEVVDFESPVEAISYYRNEYSNIDFVILDMFMPEMNGDEVFYQLLNINPFMVSIVLSGYDNVEEIYKYLLDHGLKDFLKKPINPDVLCSEIVRIINENMTVDVNKGLSMLVNNESTYIRLLKIYQEQYNDLNAKFKDCLVNDDLMGIDNIIHKIKGISLNLGGNDLYIYSSDLHQKFRKNEVEIHDIFRFVKYHNIFVKDIERVLDAQSV